MKVLTFPYSSNRLLKE